MARSDIEIIRDSLLMAMQDLDDDTLSKEERKAALDVGRTKAEIASSYAKIQKNVIEAEKLRQRKINNVASDFILGVEPKRDPKLISGGGGNG